tara:strand:+ start:13131 stop:14705 length:1575 start_codon:yes stop_codon:yes gene_type:complete
MQSGTRPKMAVFDLDKTIFDLSRRERAARRQGLKAGSKKWYEFLNRNKYILMDTPMPGTASFIRELSENGHTIAYLSGRPRHTLAATKQSLQENGFPIDAMEQDLVFLHSGKGSIRNITNHKKSVLTHLKKVFDIDFFFDDTPEFREAAKSLFIPGVYPSIAAYTGKEERQKGKSKKARKNPGHGDDLCHKTTAVHPYTGVYYACSKPEGHGGSCDYSVEMEYQVGDFDEDNPFDNPVSSAFAEDFAYEQPSLQNPSQEGLDLVEIQQIHDEALADLEKYLAERQEILDIIVLVEDENIRAGYEAMVVEYDALIDSARNTMERMKNLASQVAPPDPSYRANPVPKPRKKRDKAGRMRKESLKKYIERFMGDKKMNEEFPDRSQRFAVAATTARKFYGDKAVDKAYPRDNPRTNPHTPVHEAKSFYKKFHQKPAKNVKNVKVDIGDTWVGLGKAWSIGYRSGKETGNDQQKYIHNFGVDEESGKQFAEPDLYYVKNNDGSQMMVIMGGDWYIDVDEAGQMSWIYI